MLIRTHFIVALFFALFLLNYGENKILFVTVVLIASVLPDIDSRFSSVGSKWYFRPLQFFVKHRGIMHSLTFLILISGILYFSLQILWLPFFIGYGLHLFLDLITIAGIEPVYPFGRKFSGTIKTGGIIELFIFSIFVFLDIVMIMFYLHLF